MEGLPTYQLSCSECGIQFDPARVQTYCHACNSPLIVHFDLASLRTTLNRETIASRSRGIWRWQELLPVNHAVNHLVLGEGDTPLVELPSISKMVGVANLLLKDESLNPSGSFKARGMAVAVSRAVELGIREFFIPTAGNAGGALALYAARAGCMAHVYIPADTPFPIQVEVQVTGADMHLVQGLISDAARLAAADAQANNWFDMSTFKEPYRVEGKKIVGYELAEALNWVLPDVILIPTGGGTGLVGMWKAFDEMETLGWIGPSRPRMVAVQSSGCAPVVRAFQQGTERMIPWENAATVALGLRVPAVFADRLVLSALRESRGCAIAVPDEEILAAQNELARHEGIFASPEGAATLAGLKSLLHSGWCSPEEQVVLFNSGTGMKYL